MKTLKWTPEKRLFVTYAVLAAALIALLILVIFYAQRARSYEYELRASQQNSVVELSEFVDKINTDLKKEMYTNTPPEMARTSASLLQSSACAKEALSGISASDKFLQNTYKFLSQVGDYSIYLNKKATLGEQITAEEYENLNALLKYSNSLREELDKLFANYEAGKNFKIQTNTINTSLSDIEQSFSDYPSLIYDGPFSDHINLAKAEMLDNYKKISEDEARQKASLYSGIPADEFSTAEVDRGTIECYVFSKSTISVSVTKNGGLLCTLISESRSGETRISNEDAIKEAKKYLKKIGYEDMRETYYVEEDGSLVINFAKTQNNIIVYPDLIKVTVSKDNGRVLGVDARSYLMNHKDRTLPEPGLSEDEARKSVSPHLIIQAVKPTLIPTPSGKEYLCYEYTCVPKETGGTSGKDTQEILVYIDATTGVERQILLLLHTDDGTLTK